jgi:hypothetical protein
LDIIKGLRLISRYERISWCIFGDASKKVKEVLNKPIMFTEFGADAFNVINKSEDQKSQAYYMLVIGRKFTKMLPV